MHIAAVKTMRLADSWADAHRRYERKFQIGDMDRRTTETVVRCHPAIFREIYHRRWVNNIYFDTHALGAYEDNVTGFSQHRAKIRIRWYGDLSGDVRSPVLELKVSRSWLNWKLSFPLPSFVFDGALSRNALMSLVRAADLPEPLKQELLRFDPTLVNRYCRNYFAGRDSAFRITIDSDLAFHNVDRRGRPVLEPWWDPGYLVLELKYAEEQDRAAHCITQHFPFRLTRSSKYVTGIDAVRRDPGTGMFMLRRGGRPHI